MNKKTRNYIICGVLVILAVLFTLLVKFVDVKHIGPNESSVGFSSINRFVFETIGVNKLWYHITEWLGWITILMPIAYAFIGGIQLIKRKSLFKIDREIIVLGAFYVIVIAFYVLFEIVTINYRPVLMDGKLEASYPSSHTLMSICFCGSTVLINKMLFNNKATKIINILSIIILAIIVFGRLISGVHWFTDIIGGILIASSLLMILHQALILFKKNEFNE